MKRQRTTPYYIYSAALTLLLALALAACWPSTDRRHMEALVSPAVVAGEGARAPGSSP